MTLLKDKTALITGASRGIGRATAIAMAKQGANIALNYFGDQKEAEDLKVIILKEKVKCEIYYCDVSDFQKSKEMVADVLKDFGRVDILFNNAGIEISNSVARLSENDWDKVLDVNLKSCFNMIKHLYMNFARNGGSIINNASVCGVRGWAWQANYAASKGGLIALTKSIAKELGGRGVRCNAIAPGFIKTAMTDRMGADAKAEMLKTIPLKRLGTAEDVANVAVFLSSEMSAFVTGEVIKIDGGMCI